MAAENARKVAELSTVNASLIAERDSFKAELETLKADKTIAEKAAEEALAATALAEAAKEKAEAEKLAAESAKAEAISDFDAKVEKAAGLKALEIAGNAGSKMAVKAEKKVDPSALTGLARAIAAHNTPKVSK
jgi:hypothetical protein